MNKPIENKPRLLDQVRDKLRLKHYSYRTEQSYIAWIKRFIFFHNKQHPDTMGEKEVESFLTHLAVKRNVAASTQNQALCALLFLYRDVLGRELAWLESMQRAKRPARLPVVLTVQEVHNLLNCLEGRTWLMASLLYGGGLRLMECVRLRVKDIEFSRHEIIVREGKGGKDRVTMLPASLVEPLQTHLEKVKTLHVRDLSCRMDLVMFTFLLR